MEGLQGSSVWKSQPVLQKEPAEEAAVHLPATACAQSAKAAVAGELQTEGTGLSVTAHLIKGRFELISEQGTIPERY